MITRRTALSLLGGAALAPVVPSMPAVGQSGTGVGDSLKIDWAQMPDLSDFFEQAPRLLRDIRRDAEISAEWNRVQVV